MNPHGIEILDRANHHEVVANVAHHFEFVFFPTQRRFLNQRLMHRAGVQRARNQVRKFFAIVSNRAARTAQRERGPNHHGIPQLVRQTHCIRNRSHHFGRRYFQPNVAAHIFEQQTVLGNLDCLHRRANQLHIIFFENPRLGKLHREIQSRLSSHSWQQRIWPFGCDDRFKIFLRQRLDVRPVRSLRIRHDRRRIRIDEDYLIPFRTQRLASLRPRIVELAPLPDHNRPRANNQNLPNVSPFRHLLFGQQPHRDVSFISATKSSNRYRASCGPGEASGWY